MFQQKEMTEQELIEAAKELNMPIEEVKLMVERAKGVSPFIESQKALMVSEKGLPDLIKGLKSRTKKPGEKTVKQAAEEYQANRKKKKIARSNDNLATKEFQVSLKEDKDIQKANKVIALLNMEPHYREIALKEMSNNEKAELLRVVYKEAPKQELSWQDQILMSVKQQKNAPLEKAVQLLETAMKQLSRNPYDAFTSQALNQEAELNAKLKEDTSYQPKKIVGIYDSFTSRALNQGQTPLIATKEEQALQQTVQTMHDVFNSNFLNDEPVDNRPKTGNPAYDRFTSRVLNQTSIQAEK